MTENKLSFIDNNVSWNNSSIKDIDYPVEWKSFFEDEKTIDILKKVSTDIDEFVKDKKVIYPEPSRVFYTFHLPLNKIRVVLLGQDPYHDGNAVGLAFSVKSGTRINPSLKNIYTELIRSGFNPTQNGDISHWLKQGVLMLNTALTVIAGQPESHLHIWKDFISLVLSEISSKTNNVCWSLMGAKAIAFESYVNRSRGHVSFCTSHPSPFSALKPFRNIPAFIGSGVFKKINDYLHKNNFKKINW